MKNKEKRHGLYRGDGTNEQRAGRVGGRRESRRREEADMSGQSKGGGGFKAMEGRNLNRRVGERGGVRGG